MLGRKVVTGGEQHRLMERPSEAAHSGGNTWKRLLITVSILHCQIQPTPAQGAPVNVVPNPPYGTVGSSITLNIQGFSGQALSYTWYRRSVETYHQIAVYSVPYGVQNPSHIRQKVLPNGSLLISNLIFNDSDDYFIQIVDNTIGVIETGKRYLSVYERLSKPTIVSTTMGPVNKTDNVSLTCQTLSQDVTFQWFPPEGSPASDRRKLSLDNKTLTIINVIRENQGSYQCGIWSPVSHILSDPFTLTVTNTSPEGRKVSLFSKGSTAVIVTGVLLGSLFYSSQG
ncbi:cell adhesion molecule CEACAM7-like isoform X1 [Macrotis lagotis]|uniref:cell adhesion molecule CEACAM7-like isoform X1 n=1 Tax=Macrotis lagotis TaxID=92651 RepID=UPI003D68F309